LALAAELGQLHVFSVPKSWVSVFPAHQVEARAQALLTALPEAEVLMGLPEVGPQVLALLPPRLWGRAKAAAAYAGLIPEGEESAFPKGTSPSAKAAFHGGLGGGAA
jgi:hypothetical protein